MPWAWASRGSRENSSPQDESKKEEYLSFTELILKEIRRVNEIIEQFLTLSRPFQLNLRKSSLQDLLKNLVTLFQEEASSQRITLQAEIPFRSSLRQNGPREVDTGLHQYYEEWDAGHGAGRDSPH